MKKGMKSGNNSLSGLDMLVIYAELSNDIPELFISVIQQQAFTSMNGVSL
jgi:hypothetical protein